MRIDMRLSFAPRYTLCTYLPYTKSYPRSGAWCVSWMIASAAPRGKWMSTHTRKAQHAQRMKR